MAQKERILVVDDEPSIRKYLQTLLEVDGFEVEALSSGKSAVEKIGAGDRPDFIILDVLMPEQNGIDTLKQLIEIDRNLHVIMLSCSNEVGTVVEAIRIGALDYLTKPFEKTELDAAMLKCRQKKQLHAENQALRDYCDQITEDLSFLAASPQMVRIRQQIMQIEPGKFELANKGTIFLDEIAEMTTHLQAKLLHVLQDHQYSRLGGRHLVDIDVRVLAATNVDVQEAMKTGRFREDLYYRLNVLSINVPPLRERTSEIPLLFRHFLVKYSEKFGKVAQEPSKHLMDAAMRYVWPGNLRELENFVKRFVILEDDEGSLRELVEMTSTRQRISPREEPPPRNLGLKALVRSLKDEAEMEAIADALEKTRWCRKDAAKLLGISYKALLYKMRQFNLDSPRNRRSTAAAEEVASVVRSQ